MNMEKALTRKIGPLPAYGWLGGFAGLAYFFFKWTGGGRSSETATDPTTGAATEDTKPQGFPNYPVINITPTPGPAPTPTPVPPPPPPPPPPPRPKPGHNGGGNHGSTPSASMATSTVSTNNPTNPNQPSQPHVLRVPGVGGAGGNSEYVSTPIYEGSNARLGSGPAID